MQKKTSNRLTGSHHRLMGLFLVQLALVSICLWLGAILYLLQSAASGQLALLLAVPVVGALMFSPQLSRGVGKLVIAGGLMFLFAEMLPATWLQGPGYVLVAFASAALALWLYRQRPVLR